MPTLVAPTTERHASWLDAHHEWGPGFHEDGFGILPSDDVRSTTGFSAWLARLDRRDEGRDGSAGYRCVSRWIVDDDDAVVGGIALRFGTDPFILSAGHIGYGVRPSARGRGVAAWALARMLEVGQSLGLRRVLLVCETDNVASATTIERNGGVLERVEQHGAGSVKRYWIDLSELT